VSAEIRAVIDAEIRQGREAEEADVVAAMALQDFEYLDRLGLIHADGECRGYVASRWGTP
jgi:hypothetical protein